MRPLLLSALGVVLLCVPVGHLSGAPPPPLDQVAAVADGCGGWSSNGTYRTANAVAQPGTALVSTGGDYTHYAGFIGGAFIRPNHKNAQGAALEATPDNDYDGLADQAEVDGSAFDGHAHTDPNAADSDGDGMSDGDEARAMFNPLNSNHVLRITACVPVPKGIQISWTGRGGGTPNTIWAYDTVVGQDLDSLQLDDTVYHAGTPPWYQIAESFVDTGAGSRTQRFYRVSVPEQ